MKTLKILVLNYEFPPLGGGAGNATFYILKEFAKNPDLEINLVTSSIDKFRIEKFAPNITIHFLDIGKKKNLHYQSNKDLLRYSFNAYRYCKKLINEFDLIHAFFGIPCGYIAMKLGVPYIVSLRGSDVPFYNRRFYWLDKLLFQRLSKKVWKKAKRVIANSQGLKELVEKTSPDQQISVIYNGVDTQEFFPSSSRHCEESDQMTRQRSNPLSRDRHIVQTSYRDNNVKIVSTGRLIERKGYNYLIQALSSLDNYELILAGDGNQKENLQGLANELGVNVKFCGGVRHEDIPALLRNADIFVLPSLNEGMSNSILEAMACGLPIIATDTGGSAELIKNNGFIVPKGSPKALKEAITKYMDNPDLFQEHGLQSRKCAEEMSWKQAAKQYSDLYQ